MNTSVFTSIRAKIFILMLLGIAGMIILTATNTIFDQKKNRNFSISRSSQEIARNILETIMLEGKYISHQNPALLPRIAGKRKEAARALKTIDELSDTPEIEKLAAGIAAASREHVELFSAITRLLSRLNNSRQDFKQTNEQIDSLITQAIRKSDDKERRLLMEGETIDPNEKLTVALIKDILTFNAEKSVNLLDLFIFAEPDKYLKRCEELERHRKAIFRETENITVIIKEQELIKTWQQLKALIALQQQTESAIFSFWKQEQQLFTQLEENSSSILDTAKQIVALSQQGIEESISTSQTIGLAVAGFGLVAILLIGFLIVAMIVKPINSTVNMLKDIAEGEGDLTRRLEIRSRDEMSELAHWFNQFIGKIQTIIGEVASQLTQLNQASGKLSKLSAGMSAGSEQVLQKASNVAAAAEEMSSNAGQVAATTESATGNIFQATEAVQEITSVIGEIAGNTVRARTITNESVTQADSANRQVNELGEAAQEIGKVIETITSISSQVNLLALNATIEAARAGEAGKGFAVVANEIKELAQQTADAAYEIQQRIESIQHSTKGTIAEIGTITVKVNEVSDIVGTIAAAIEEQTATTREIAETMTSVSEHLNEVNSNISQSSTVAGEIAEEIAEVTGASQELTDSSTEVNQQALDLGRLAEQLDRIVKQFKI